MVLRKGSQSLRFHSPLRSDLENHLGLGLVVRKLANQDRIVVPEREVNSPHVAPSRLDIVYFSNVIQEFTRDSH